MDLTIPGVIQGLEWVLSWCFVTITEGTWRLIRLQIKELKTSKALSTSVIMVKFNVPINVYEIKNKIFLVKVFPVFP